MAYPSPRYLICSCCDQECRGRQWHNRDAGYGLCPGCVEFCAKRCSPEDMRSAYGVRGVHYDLEYKLGNPLREAMAAKDAWRHAGGQGPIRMPREAFEAMHTDFRSQPGDKTHPSCTAMCPKTGATVLVPVEFV